MTQALSYEKDHDRPLSVFDVVWVMLVLCSSVQPVQDMLRKGHWKT